VNEHSHNTAPTTYAIRVDGHLDDHWSARLGEPDLTHDEDGSTTLSVSIADQAQLHGVLVGLRDIGAVITELRTTSPVAGPVKSRAPTLWDHGAVIRSEWDDRALRGTVVYPVRTARLFLRPLTEDDVEDVLAYRGRSDVCRWVPFEPMSRSEVLGRIHSSLAQLTDEGQALTAGVELPAARVPEAVADRQRDRRGVVIGDVVLMWHSREHSTGEIGYVFHPDHSGQGFATEAVQALLDIAFETCGLHRVIARIDARNLASLRLAERVGMRQEAHLVENEWFKGAWGDEIDYAILRREWLSKRK
jgi:RimJ/RimL family protein N-acetyltransferase